MAKKEAVEATVSGHDQQVGFRALVMKQAIEYNLAGSARNDANQVVRFTLQGSKKRINWAVATIRKGTERSSDIEVTTIPTKVELRAEGVYNRGLDFVEARHQEQI